MVHFSHDGHVGRVLFLYSSGRQLSRVLIFLPFFGAAPGATFPEFTAHVLADPIADSRTLSNHAKSLSIISLLSSLPPPSFSLILWLDPLCFSLSLSVG